MSFIVKGIDLPKTEYEEVIIRIKHTGEVCDAHNIHLYAQAIQIPKGHGEIKDVKNLYKFAYYLYPSIDHFMPSVKAVELKIIDLAPTILESED